MKKISAIVASILLASVVFAANEQAKQPVVAKQAPVAAAQADTSDTGAYDYRLERESCCGPQ